MSRQIDSRIIIEGTLTALTPLHVGGYGDSPDTDLPLAVNGKGELYVPGTSLAGVLRSWCEKTFGKTVVNPVWGYQDPDNDKGQASNIYVEDAGVTLPTDAPVEIRDGVGIDRKWGSAANGIKYDRAVLPRESTLRLVLSVELKGSGDTTKAMLAHLIDALIGKKIRLGASKTRGLGRVKFTLDSEKSKSQTLSKREGIMQLLAGGGDSIDAQQVGKWKEAGGLGSPNDRTVTFTLGWEPVQSTMVKTGYDGFGVDMLPLVSAKDKGVALVLPGSSIKGVLRAHAERIVRTLLDIDAPAKDDRQNFMHQLGEPPLIDELFGARGKDRPDNENHKGLGALSVDDCYADPVMERGKWLAVEQATADKNKSAKDWDISTNLKNLNSGSFQIEHHTSVDRWTGGAADSALFSALVPQKMAWEPIRIDVDYFRLEGLELEATMLLFLLLRDIAAGRITLGFATNRGMGEIKLRTILTEGKMPVTGNGTLAFGDATIAGVDKEALTEAWTKWLDKQRKLQKQRPKENANA